MNKYKINYIANSNIFLVYEYFVTSKTAFEALRKFHKDNKDCQEVLSCELIERDVHMFKHGDIIGDRFIIIKTHYDDTSKPDIEYIDLYEMNGVLSCMNAAVFVNYLNAIYKGTYSKRTVKDIINIDFARRKEVIK